MTVVELFLTGVASAIATGFFLTGIYDIRIQRHQKRIAELEKENVELHFEADRANAVREQFEKECG